LTLRHAAGGFQPYASFHEPLRDGCDLPALDIVSPCAVIVRQEISQREFAAQGGPRKSVEWVGQGLQWPSISPMRRETASLMPKNTLPADVAAKLRQSAKKVMKNAHAPYSKFRVGAAILLSNGKIFSGCNVENASYGMTNCAERTAIFSAVAQLGPKIEIRAVSVVNDHGVPCSPCGACRQVIYEFGPDATIFFQGANGPRQAHITELLPEGFRLQ
jgi:cytidine deaminase